MVIRRSLLFLSLLTMFSFRTMAQWNINTDWESIGQVGKNTVFQLGVENAHNALLDSVRNIQEKVAFQSAAIATARQLHLNSMMNSRDFDVESVYFRTVKQLSSDISTLAPKVISEVSKAPLSGKTSMLIQISGLITDVSQIINDFRNIVAGKPSNEVLFNPGINASAGVAVGDGKNIMGRDQRLTMAMSLIANLSSIKVKLLRMKYVAEYATWSDVLYQIDRKTWANTLYGQSLANRLIDEWNAL